jgi:hypothetical protein
MKILKIAGISGIVVFLAALSALVILVTREDTRQKKYGVAFDDARAKRGIPPVGPDAKTMSDWGAFWTYHSGHKKGRYCKHVFLKGDELVEELDAYNSGMQWIGPEGRQCREYVQVSYSYEAERRGDEPWSARLFSKDGETILDSIAEVEALLDSWGVNRLDPTPPAE